MQKQTYRGFMVSIDWGKAWGPYFSNLLQYRINKKKAVNVVIVGEAGSGKSYMAIDLCRVIAGKTKEGKDRLKISQVVFTYKQFMEQVQKLRPGQPIIFDEPSYAMGKREWYKDLNRALVQTIESFRYKRHPLFIPIINKSLLDKTVRDHLIQFQVVMKDRGKADVYELDPSQFIDKVFHRYFCHLKFGMLSTCQIDSCLDCKKLEKKDSTGAYECMEFRAQYERKKASIQEVRYEQAADLAQTLESRELTDTQIENLSLAIKELWFIDDKIDTQRLRVALFDKYGVRLSNNKSYTIKAMLEMHHPELVE